MDSGEETRSSPDGPSDEPKDDPGDGRLDGLTENLGLDPAIPNHDQLLGQDIGGVTIVRLIAEGGMGRVYEGKQQKPQRSVAVKLIKPGFLSKEVCRRFDNESEVLGRLRHPYIAQIYSAGISTILGGQFPYFVMEYIPDALPLTIYAEQKRLTTRQRLELFSKVCEAIAHGHEKGVIHRDLKPSNILVEKSGAPKVIDFGIARNIDTGPEQTTALTDVGQLVGTVQYMSPEQFQADPSQIDTRTDVYALGVILYELLTGKPPYEIRRKQIFEAAEVVRKHRFVAPSRLNSNVGRDVEHVTERCLQKNRLSRYADASQLAHALDGLLRAPPSSPERATTGSPSTRGFARLMLLGGCLAVLGVTGVFTFFTVGRTSTSPPYPAPVEGPDVPHELTNSLGMRFRMLSPGTFKMGQDDGEGDERPVHEVRITRPFYLGVYEVTNGEWKALMGDVPSRWKDDDRPVERVTWEQAVAFCTVLSNREEERAAGRMYRLPTEAEWEYACRAGTTTPFSCANDATALSDHGWFGNNSGRDPLNTTDQMVRDATNYSSTIEGNMCQTHPVGLKKPNPWGLYDMHGNVWEWCSDWKQDYSTERVTNPQGPSGGIVRVTRGGCWKVTEWDCRSANRDGVIPTDRGPTIGFRIVMSTSPSHSPNAGERVSKSDL